MPARHTDNWINFAGDSLPVPPPVPDAPPRGLALLDLQANSSRTWCTMTRYAVEQSFLSDWRFQILGNRYCVHPARLEPAGYPPTPQASKVEVLHLIKAALEDEVFSGYTLRFLLPRGVTFRMIGERAVRNVNRINWLDPQR